MKQRNIIILIVGLILVGLLLFSGMSKLSFSTFNPEETHNVEQPQSVDNNSQIIQNPIENNDEPNIEEPSTSDDVSSNHNSNST